MKKIIEDESDIIQLSYGFPTLDKIINTLIKFRKTTPGDARARVWVDGYDDDEFIMCFEWSREETDEEYSARITKEYWEAKRIEDDEKLIYERLKAKFEGGK